MPAALNDQKSPSANLEGAATRGISERAQILSVMRRFWAAMDARDAATAASLVAADAAFVDAFAPHIWAGKGAFQGWLRDLWAFCERENIVVASTALRDPSSFLITGAKAYVVSPAVMASARSGDLVSQSGVITMALARQDDRWHITAMCWAGQ